MFFLAATLVGWIGEDFVQCTLLQTNRGNPQNGGPNLQLFVRNCTAEQQKQIIQMHTSKKYH